ncbi:hypothetical protein C8J57DRAFT_1729795 [Mycena rebaudengoi]|nr:hypothetical protein C8J57DRAFT_1729795 [Mycena rebaudengoi]
MPAKQHPYRVVLHSSLRDPLHRDSSCILGILCAIASISNAGGQTDFQQPYFLRCAMDFICGAASEDEHLARRQRLMACQCNLERPTLLDIHRKIRAEVTPVKSLDLTLITLCGNLSAVLYTMTPGKFRKPKEGVHPEYQPWPSSLADILPHGKNASEILATVLLWATEPGHGQAIFSLITSLTRFWEPSAVELFRTPSVFLLATEHLDHSVDTFPGGVVSRSDVWVMNVNAITMFFTRVSLVDGRGFIHIITPLLEQMNSIAARMSPIWEPLNEIVMEETRMWFTQSRRLATPRTTVEEHLSTGDIFLEGYGPEPLTQYEEMYLSAFAGIWEARNRNRCMHLGCTNSLVSRSAVCARCGVIRYCTRECQKAAWKGVPLVPHKPLCDQIWQLRVGLEMTDASSWDALILDSKFARSAVELLEVCRPHAAGIDISLVAAIRIGLSILSSKKVTKDDSIAPSDA